MLPSLNRGLFTGISIMCCILKATYHFVTPHNRMIRDSVTGRYYIFFYFLLFWYLNPSRLTGVNCFAYVWSRLAKWYKIKIDRRPHRTLFLYTSPLIFDDIYINDIKFSIRTYVKYFVSNMPNVHRCVEFITQSEVRDLKVVTVTFRRVFFSNNRWIRFFDVRKFYYETHSFHWHVFV